MSDQSVLTVPSVSGIEGYDLLMGRVAPPEAFAHA